MKKVLVIGASTIDYLAQSEKKINMRESNPGFVYRSWGGVGRNIAENLARLNIDTTLLTVLGEDATDFMSMAKSIKLKLYHLETHFTSSYVAVHDDSGDLVLSIAATDQMNKLTPTEIKRYFHLFEQSDLLVLDANLSEPTLAFIFKHYDKPIYVDLVSPTKALKLTNHLSKIHTLKLNLSEGKAITLFDEPEQIGQVLLNQGVKEVFITMGMKGVYHFNSQLTNYYQKIFDQKIENVTGCGDAFFAGVIFAEMKALDPLKTGTLMSHLTMRSKDAVYKKIKSNQLISLVKE